ncbi:MAG: hypothetical protein JKY50_19480 [Oleispira sp.]|nr:hypothetical protein [Oleispira sp.]
MIESVDNRLMIWGESVAADIEGGRRCSAGFDVEDRGGETFGNKILLDVEIEETDRAVKSLDETLRNCVVEIYVRVDSTVAQKIKVLCISRRTLFRYRDKAHLQIKKFAYDAREKGRCF